MLSFLTWLIKIMEDYLRVKSFFFLLYVLFIHILRGSDKKDLKKIGYAIVDKAAPR